MTPDDAVEVLIDSWPPHADPTYLALARAARYDVEDAPVLADWLEEHGQAQRASDLRDLVAASGDQPRLAEWLVRHDLPAPDELLVELIRSMAGRPLAELPIGEWPHWYPEIDSDLRLTGHVVDAAPEWGSTHLIYAGQAAIEAAEAEAAGWRIEGGEAWPPEGEDES